MLSDGSEGEGEWQMPIAIRGDKESSLSYTLLKVRATS